MKFLIFFLLFKDDNSDKNKSRNIKKKNKTIILKELRHDLSSLFFHFYCLEWSILMFLIFVKIWSSNSSYKRVTEVSILCSVNKSLVLLLFANVLYWYKFKSDLLFVVDKNYLRTYWISVLGLLQVILSIIVICNFFTLHFL